MEPLADLWKAEIPYVSVSTSCLLEKKKSATFSIWLGGTAVDAYGVLFLIFCFSLPQVSSCSSFTFSTYENLTWGSWESTVLTLWCLFLANFCQQISKEQRVVQSEEKQTYMTTNFFLQSHGLIKKVILFFHEAKTVKMFFFLLCTELYFPLEFASE